MKAIILAAGEGRRMKSKTQKHVHEILGKPLLSYIIDAEAEATGEKPVVVIGHNRDQIREKIKEDVIYAIQEEQLGTGHGTMAAAGNINPDEDIVVQLGDTPLVTADTIKKLAAFHINNNNAVSVASVRMSDPSGYGRIIRGEDGSFTGITEQKDLRPEQLSIDEINTGLLIFKGSALLDALKLLKNDNAQSEYYLTDTVEIITKQGLNAGALTFNDPDEFLGVNDRVQLAAAISAIRDRINKKHMLGGVTIIDPLSTYIDADVSIGEDTVIYPNTFIEKGSSIGCGCIIGQSSRITNSTVCDGAEIMNSVVTDTYIGEKTTVGPFAYMRMNSHIGAHCRIGDFVEVKNSTIGDNTKASHLAYIGDADAGSNINFGCGTITVNYDGKHKHRTTIEDNAFIGSNSNLIAPVKVKTGAYIAAGSTITDDVPSEGMTIARARQVHKPDWRRKD